MLFADGGLYGGSAGGLWGTPGTDRGKEGQHKPKGRGRPRVGEEQRLPGGRPGISGVGGRRDHIGSFGESRAVSWLEGCVWGAGVGGGVEREGDGSSLKAPKGHVREDQGSLITQMGNCLSEGINRLAVEADWMEHRAMFFLYHLPVGAKRNRILSAPERGN